MERRLLAQVTATEEAQQRYAEAVRQPPAPFPEPGRAIPRPAPLPPASEFPLAAFRQESIQREREAVREEPEEFGEFESSTYDDLEDYDYDDFFDDVGDEDEDSYGEDAA